MQEILIAVNDNGDGEMEISLSYNMTYEECKKVLEECIRTVETRIMEEDHEKNY